MKEWELESILFSNLWFLCTLTHSKYTYWLVNISFKIEGENKHICRETKPKKVHFQQTCTTKIYFCRLEVKHNRLNIHSTGMEEEHYKWGLVPDGGVEGCALTPYCENTRITTNCWTIINRKTLEHTKKDTLHPKTKEKPQWDGRRGAITIKPNPITAGWVTHKLENTYTTEVHPLEWRFWATRQASQSGGLAMGGGIPRESDFEG